MPTDEIRIVVRKAISDIEVEVRRKFAINTQLIDTALEPDALVLTFAGLPGVRELVAENVGGGAKSSHEPAIRRLRRRKRVKARQRTKTRGWDISGKFVNSKGQSCTIYRPMLEALQGKRLKRREAYSTVRQILVDNGNSPKPTTVEYFLNNTLEYIASKSSQPQSAGASGEVEE